MDRANIPFPTIKEAANALVEGRLLIERDCGSSPRPREI
jgi:hypothetical protein